MDNMQNAEYNALKTKRQSKNSVFVSFFQDKEMILQLYKELHPEDTDVCIDDISVQTLTSVLINTIYNDLGFIVKDKVQDKFVLLIEAQSTWNANMTLRMLFYLSETYRRYLSDTSQSEHLQSRVKLPQPDLYIVYSGDRQVPKEVSFSEDYFDGKSPVDLKVKILSEVNTTLHGQYIGFCKVFDEQHKLYQDSQKCAEETFRLCIEKGYLTDYFNNHKKEVVSMMAELFDEETARRAYDTAVRAQSWADGRMEGKIEGKIEGKMEGETENSARIACKLLTRGKDNLEEISDLTGISLEKVKELARQIKPV